MTIDILNEDEMRPFTEKLYKKLKLPQVIALEGELGSGKTTFTRYIAEQVGLSEPVTSPTFNLVQEYLGENISLIHADFYRLEQNYDLNLLGFDDYFKRQNCLIIIEWASKLRHLLPVDTLHLYFDYIDQDSRRISLVDGIL